MSSTFLPTLFLEDGLLKSVKGWILDERVNSVEGGIPQSVVCFGVYLFHLRPL